MRTVITETKVFEFSELSEAAKDHARENYSRFLWDDGEMQERMQEIADGLLEDAGFGPAEGLTYALYTPGGEPRYSTEGEVTAGGEEWQVRISNNGTRYGSMSVDIYTVGEDGDERAPQDVRSDAVVVVDEIMADLHALNRKIYKGMHEEDEYMTSDEEMQEISESNGYEYTEAGDLV